MLRVVLADNRYPERKGPRAVKDSRGFRKMKGPFGGWS